MIDCLTVSLFVSEFILAPQLFEVAGNSASEWVLAMVGLFAVLLILLTNYELGMARLIPMPWHLSLDVLMGFFLAAAPFLLNFPEWTRVPSLLLGLFMVMVGLCSSTATKDHVCCGS